MSESEGFGTAGLERAGAGPLRPADPTRIGPYVPVGVLGSGGMGRVYLVRPEDDSPGLFAVKVIRPEYAESPEFRRRFEREAAMLQRVQDAHAPRLRGTGFEDELLWMATDYIPGLSLTDAVRELGPLEPAGVWRLVGDLGQALSALADAEVVHRDLKPSNVILSADGAHVIDFGISQAADSSAITTTGQVVGTPSYMSPEHIRDGRVGTASDMFSLGCLLVYAATGSAPFGDGTGLDVMHRVAFEPPKQEVIDELAAIDSVLSSLLTVCLAKEPERRPTPRQLIETAATRQYASQWQQRLNDQVVARKQACESLSTLPAPRTTQLRRPGAPAPASASTPASTPAPVQAPGPGFGPAPAQQHTPPPPGTPYPPATPSQPSGRKPSRMLASIGAGVAVCAIAVGAILFIRSGGDAAGAAAETTTPPATASASASPEASATGAGDTAETTGKPDEEKQEKDDPSPDGDEDEDDKGGDEPGAQPTPSRTESATSGGGSGSGSGGGSQPTATVTADPSKPTTPPWIAKCKYYSGTALTQYGDSGKRVVQVQCMLAHRGYNVGSAGVDGQFGPDTRTAVRKFQGDKGLSVDGQVGPNTWGALRSTKK